jgi:hypothetical protein
MEAYLAPYILGIVAFTAGWAGGYMHGMESMHTYWLKRREHPDA